MTESDVNSLSGQVTEIKIESKTFSENKQLPKIYFVTHDYFVDKMERKLFEKTLFTRYQKRKYELQYVYNLNYEEGYLQDYEKAILTKLSLGEKVVVFLGGYDTHYCKPKSHGSARVHAEQDEMLERWWRKFCQKIKEILETREKSGGRVVFAGMIPKGHAVRFLQREVARINELFRSAAAANPAHIGYLEFSDEEFKSDTDEFIESSGHEPTRKGMIKIMKKFKEVFESLADSANQMAENERGEFQV